MNVRGSFSPTVRGLERSLARPSAGGSPLGLTCSLGHPPCGLGALSLGGPGNLLWALPAWPDPKAGRTSPSGSAGDLAAATASHPAPASLPSPPPPRRPQLSGASESGLAEGWELPVPSGGGRVSFSPSSLSPSLPRGRCGGALLCGVTLLSEGLALCLVDTRRVKAPRRLREVPSERKRKTWKGGEEMEREGVREGEGEGWGGRERERREAKGLSRARHCPPRPPLTAHRP